MTIQEVETHLSAIGRPRLSFAGGLAGVQKSAAELRQWDEEHPALAARWRELIGQMNALEAEEAEKAEAKRLADALLRRLDKEGVARAGAALVAPRATEALRVVQAWWASEATWLLLCGGVGSGKTVAAAWAMREGLKAWRSCSLRTASRLARLSGFDEGAAELERLKLVHLLVVDDVGAEASTSWGAGLLSEVLDARHQGKRRTIITTNLGLEAFKARVGERLADRIREDGQVHALQGRSMRRKGAA